MRPHFSADWEWPTYKKFGPTTTSTTELLTAIFRLSPAHRISNGVVRVLEVPLEAFHATYDAIVPTTCEEHVLHDRNEKCVARES
jgi:hypothetical protein